MMESSKSLEPSAQQLHNLSYQLRIKDNTLDDNLPTPVAHARNTCACRMPNTSLNTLDLLPIELLHAILPILDLQSLSNFQRVNRRATAVLKAVPEYRAVATYARTALVGSYSIGTSRFITCRDLYTVLCTADCEFCGDFAGFLYILTCKRVCFICLSQDERCLPLRRSHAVRRFGLERKSVDKLPHMRSIPGTYSPNRKRAKGRLLLVDFDSARCAGIAIHGCTTAMEQHVASSMTEELQSYNARTLAGTGRRTRRLRTEDIFDAKSGNALRFMAIVRLPHLDSISQNLEYGSHCVGCRKASRSRSMHWRRKFTQESFITHLRLCGQIVDGKSHVI